MKAFGIAILLALWSLPAFAHPDDRYFESGAGVARVAVAHNRRNKAPGKYREHWRSNIAEGGRGQVIGGRPAGCPARFCGCGASLEVFGRIIPALNLAANWLRFPRTSPAPGMVAARHGHVFVLRSHIAGNVWLVHDSNSGGRQTRIHPRSLAGFAVVNPHGVRA